MPERLHSDQREQMKATVLAYLAEHGPCPESDVRWALDPIMSAHFVSRTLTDLIAAGKVTSRKVRLSNTIQQRGVPRTYGYLAAVYEIVTPGRGRRGRSPRETDDAERNTQTRKRADVIAAARGEVANSRLASVRIPPQRWAEIRAFVLKYLKEQGPRPFSEIRFAVGSITSEEYLRRAVKELVAEGRLSARKTTVTSSVVHGDSVQLMPHRTTLYGIAGQAERVSGGHSAEA